MQILKKLSDDDLIKSLKEEVIKTRSEIKCAHNDIRSARTRLEFASLILDELEERKK
jgi:hypothetical protein